MAVTPQKEKGMAAEGISRRYFFYGSLLSGAVPSRGYGSVSSLKALRYGSPNGLLNIVSVGSAGRPFRVAAPACKKCEKAVRTTDFRPQVREGWHHT